MVLIPSRAGFGSFCLAPADGAFWRAAGDVHAQCHCVVSQDEDGPYPRLTPLEDFP